MVNLKRPRLLLILIIATFIQGALFLTFTVEYTLSLQLVPRTVQAWITDNLVDLHALASTWLMVGTWGSLGFTSVIIIAGQRAGRLWAWTATFLVEGTVLVITLQSYVSGRAGLARYGAMALAIAITFLINQRDIQFFFHARQRERLEVRSGQ